MVSAGFRVQAQALRTNPIATIYLAQRRHYQWGNCERQQEYRERQG